MKLVFQGKISEELKNKITDVILKGIKKVAKTDLIIPKKLNIKLDIKGHSTLGMYRGNGNHLEDGLIRLHPLLIDENFDKYIEVILHELSHSIQRNNFPFSKSHGKEFKNIASIIGCPPKSTVSIGESKVLKELINKKKKSGYFLYKCKCTPLRRVTKKTHLKLQSGAGYVCGGCNIEPMEVK